jgi:hypothetical protein
MADTQARPGWQAGSQCLAASKWEAVSRCMAAPAWKMAAASWRPLFSRKAAAGWKAHTGSLCLVAADMHVCSRHLADRQPLACTRFWQPLVQSRNLLTGSFFWQAGTRCLHICRRWEEAPGRQPLAGRQCSRRLSGREQMQSFMKEPMAGCRWLVGRQPLCGSRGRYPPAVSRWLTCRQPLACSRYLAASCWVVVIRWLGGSRCLASRLEFSGNRCAVGCLLQIVPIWLASISWQVAWGWQPMPCRQAVASQKACSHWLATLLCQPLVWTFGRMLTTRQLLVFCRWLARGHTLHDKSAAAGWQEGKRWTSGTSSRGKSCWLSAADCEPLGWRQAVACQWSFAGRESAAGWFEASCQERRSLLDATIWQLLLLNRVSLSKIRWFAAKYAAGWQAVSPRLRAAACHAGSHWPRRWQVATGWQAGSPGC